MHCFRRTALAALTVSSASALQLGVARTAWSRSNGALLRGGAQQMSGLATYPVNPEIALTSATILSSSAAATAWAGDVLVVPFWEPAENTTLLTPLSGAMADLDGAVGGALADLIEDMEFKGAAGKSHVIALPRSVDSGARKLAVVGLGKADDWKVAGARKLGDSLATIAKEQKAKAVGALLPSEPALSADEQQALAEAILLGTSPDTRFKTGDDDDNKPPPLEKVELLGGTADAAALDRASKIAYGVLLTKALVGSPANVLTPTTMAAQAAAIASEFSSFSLKVLEQAECEAMGMGAYLGVSQGACEPPKFIHLTYTPPGGKAAKKVALVGKGLTFDSGGYNIKAGAGSMIEKMKFDMGGAGAVLGAARCIGGLAPPGVEVHFIIAACENMVSAEAMRPGDILTASNSKTIEVLNTDAEGRLTLADALVYADRLGDVDAIVDIATLTGACIVALGPDYAAMYTDDEELKENLMTGGELLWRMPLAPEYKEQLKSPIADLANLGAPGGGGSITAALFLKEFIHDVSKDAQWAHLDIAGPVWNDKKGGATGFGVRTLVGLVESMSA